MGVLIYGVERECFYHMHGQQTYNKHTHRAPSTFVPSALSRSAVRCFRLRGLALRFGLFFARLSLSLRDTVRLYDTEDRVLIL